MAGRLVESGHDLPRLSNGLEGVLVIIKPDLGIESSQKFAFHHRTGQLVEPAGVSQKVEIGQHGIGFTTQLLISALQLLPKHGPTRLKITEPFTQLLTNQPAIRVHLGAQGVGGDHYSVRGKRLEQLGQGRDFNGPVSHLPLYQDRARGVLQSCPPVSASATHGFAINRDHRSSLDGASMHVHPEHQASVEAIRVQALKRPADRGPRRQLLLFLQTQLGQVRGVQIVGMPLDRHQAPTPRHRQGQDREADSDVSRVCPWDTSCSGGHGPQAGVTGRGGGG